jgi:hypothetical protein
MRGQPLYVTFSCGHHFHLDCLIRIFLQNAEEMHTACQDELHTIKNKYTNSDAEQIFPDHALQKIQELEKNRDDAMDKIHHIHNYLQAFQKRFELILFVLTTVAGTSSTLTSWHVKSKLNKNQV